VKRECGTLKNSLIKDRIVLGVNNTKTRDRLLRVQGLTLKKVLDVLRSAEETERQLKELDNESVVFESYLELERRRPSHFSGKHLRTVRKNELQSRCSIAGTVEPDMA